MEELISGHFCRFKPRAQWPSAIQQRIPEDKLYFIHPVIVLDTLNGGLVDVVTTTSTPHLTTSPANYIRISIIVDKSPTDLQAPLVVNRKLPKESWAVLDSKRSFPIAILEPWVESGSRFVLKNKKTRKRLRECVKARMKTVAHQPTTLQVQPATSVSAPQPPPKPAATVSTNPWARAMVPPGPPPSIPLPLLPTPPSTVLNKPPSPPPRTTSLSSAAAEPSSADLDIREIKKSLAGLKVAVDALEELCEKLESKTESTSSLPLSIPTDATPDTQTPPPPRLIALKASRILGISSEQQELTGYDDVTVKFKSKTSRLKRWGSRFFSTK